MCCQIHDTLPTARVRKRAVYFMFEAAKIMTVNWFFHPPICVGLGDRLGTIIALSALASLHNTSYVMHVEWCTDPMRALIGNPAHVRYIPEWTGYDYPLETLHATLALPSNIRLYPSRQEPRQIDLALVGESGTIPAWDGTPQTSTMFCRALTMDRAVKRSWPTHECEQAYKKAGDHVTPIDFQAADDTPFVLVHFRSPDNNPCLDGYHQDPFCTPAVLQELHAAGVYVKVISNNHSLSMQWLGGLPSVHLVHSSSAFKDMVLALSAVAIVQHASQGWSSYTSVPAMARGIPLINTYTGGNHRYEHFKQYGEVPREFHRCHETQEFVRKAVSAWRQASAGSLI